MIFNPLFGGSGINYSFHFANSVNGETSARGVLANHFRIRRDVDAVKLVFGDITLNPLDLRTEVTEDPPGLGGDFAQFARAQFSGVRQRAFDHIFGHTFFRYQSGLFGPQHDVHATWQKVALQSKCHPQKKYAIGVLIVRKLLNNFWLRYLPDL